MIRPIIRLLLAWAAFLVLLASPGMADILFNGVPNLDEERLYAWYDGNEAIGQDGNPATPVWPNKQGDLRRDIDYAFCGACISAELEPVLTENEQMALRYVGVATQRERGEYDMDTQAYDQWGVLEGQFTVFVAATVRDADEAYFFSGIKQAEKPTLSPTEVSANYPPEEVAPGRWTVRSESLIQTVPVVADELQFHAFTFREDGIGQHHVNGDLVGQAYVGTPWMEGFVLGGREGLNQRATVDFAEVLLYEEALSDLDRQAIETYLDQKYYGVPGVPGDFDGDGLLTAIDIDLLSAVVQEQSHDPAYDLNADNLVDGVDRDVWVHDLRDTYYGDADLDGEFTSTDFVAVFVAGKYESGEGAGWLEGDWDGEGTFGTSDFVVAFIDGGYEQNAARSINPVPEPHSCVLLLLGTLALVVRGRQP